MPKYEKEAMLSELKKSWEGSPYVFFSTVSGLRVSELTELRRSLAPKAKRAMLVKHSLLKKTLKEKGMDAGSEKFLKGSLLITFGTKDPQEISKTIVDFQKGHEKFVVQGAIIDGAVIAPEAVKELAKLPSREVLLGKVVSGINTPIARLVLTLGSLIRTFVVDLNQVVEKKK